MKDILERAYKIYCEGVKLKKYSESISELDNLTQEGLDVDRALQWKSHLFHLSGNNEQAIKTLNEAIELERECKGLYYDRGRLHHFIGGFEGKNIAPQHL